MDDAPAAVANDNDSSNVDLAAEIVSAYVGHNTIGITEIPALIASVHAALSGLGTGAEPEAPPKKPAVPIRRSVERMSGSSRADTSKSQRHRRRTRSSTG